MYIKVRLQIDERTPADSRNRKVRISRLDSDMPGTQTLDTNILLHALAGFPSEDREMTADAGFPYRFPFSF